MPGCPAVGKRRQENAEIEISLGYTVRQRSQARPDQTKKFRSNTELVLQWVSITFQAGAVPLRKQAQKKN